MTVSDYLPFGMTNALARSALTALGDPTRRQIFEVLATGPGAVGVLTREVTVSRPAVSQHLRVLKEAGLVRETVDGTRRIYAIDPRGIGALRAWMDQYWAAALISSGAQPDSGE